MAPFNAYDLLSDRQPKRFTTGAERIAMPEDTLAKVAPFMGEMGITRLADLTGLDNIAVPTAQAVRPMARSLSVNQGKGVTPLIARVSALMESTETWHAENPRLEVFSGTHDVMIRAARTVDLSALAVRDDIPKSILHSAPMEWIMGMDLFDHAPILVPADCVLMDYSQPPQSSFLYRTSNGLAAGNSKAEAAVSALLEVIERDCIADFDEFTAQERAAAKLTSQSVLDALDPMIPEGLARGQAHVDVWDIKNDLGIPCFYAIVQSGFSQHTGKFIRGFAGSGAHLNSDVALSRAVTEAVQSRLTVISGARDDLDAEDYAPPAQHPAQLMTSRIFEGEMARPYRRLSISCPTAGEDLDVILSTLYRNGCSSAALIDLTHTDKDIPVVRAVVPGLGQPIGTGLSRLGKRKGEPPREENRPPGVDSLTLNKPKR